MGCSYVQPPTETPHSSQLVLFTCWVSSMPACVSFTPLAGPVSYARRETIWEHHGGCPQHTSFLHQDLPFDCCMPILAATLASTSEAVTRPGTSMQLFRCQAGSRRSGSQHEGTYCFAGYSPSSITSQEQEPGPPTGEGRWHSREHPPSNRARQMDCSRRSQTRLRRLAPRDLCSGQMTLSAPTYHSAKCNHQQSRCCRQGCHAGLT
jgi:hypothetical protein